MVFQRVYKKGNKSGSHILEHSTTFMKGSTITLSLVLADQAHFSLKKSYSFEDCAFIAIRSTIDLSIEFRSNTDLGLKERR